MNSPFTETTIRVRFSETDAMGVVYYANYLVWFEVARGAFIRERGIDYNALAEQGFHMPIVEARCRYRAPVRYDDEVVVRIAVLEVKRSTLRFEYRLTCRERLVAEGETLQMLVDTKGRPRAFPSDLAARLAAP